MKELLKEIKEVENKLSDLKQKATEYSDGYKYVAELFCYGSRTEYTFKNEYATQELCNDYYGDNGIVHVYTTNPNHTISNRGGDVTIIEPHIAAQLIDDVTLHALMIKQTHREALGDYQSAHEDDDHYADDDPEAREAYLEDKEDS